MFVRAATGTADEPNRVRIIHHHQGFVLFGEIANALEIGDVAVHGKDAVGSDHAEAGPGGFRQLGLKIRHVVVAVAQTPALGKAHAIDDAGMVEFIGNNGVFGTKQSFKQAAVGIEAGPVKNSVLGSKELANTLLQLLMNALRSANKTNRRHAVSPAVQRRACGGDHGRMVRQSKVIICAKIEDFLTRGCFDVCLLRRADDALRLT